MEQSETELNKLERLMKLALQKAGQIIPTDIEDGIPEESLGVPIPESLSNFDTAMSKILGEGKDETGDNKIVQIPSDQNSDVFAIAARNGKVKLSQETLNKLKRG
jgi:hypothetical protein